MHNDQEAWLEAMAEMVKGFRTACLLAAPQPL